MTEDVCGRTAQIAAAGDGICFKFVDVDVLVREQFLFALRAEEIVTDAAVASHDSVAGNKQWNGVRCQRCTDGAVGVRFSDLGRDPRVGANLSRWNFRSFAQHCGREIAEAAKVDGKMRSRSGVQCTTNLAVENSARLTGGEDGSTEPFSELSLELVRIFTEATADTP